MVTTMATGLGWALTALCGVPAAVSRMGKPTRAAHCACESEVWGGRQEHGQARMPC